MSEPNTNCLDGWQCHKCKSYGPFYIQAMISTLVLMSDEGNLEEGHCVTDWEDDSYARCTECQHAATVAYFTSDRTALDDIVEAIDERTCAAVGHERTTP